jgi:hypothetical protein
MLYPATLLDVLAFQVSVTLCCAGVVPVPPNDSATEPFMALLVKARVAKALPEALGAKVTLKEALWPEAIVSGKEIPLTENSVPVMLAEDTITGPLVAVSLAACLLLDPTVTFPKLMLAGLTASLPGVTALPEPVSGTEREELTAFELTDSAPFIVPVDEGAKLTLKVKL